MFPSSDLLAEEAFVWVARRARLRRQPLHVDPADKWIIRSGFQKAIRRGRAEEALHLALALHRLDRRYAFHAALTVATEDVGFGSPEALLWATAARSSAFRKQVGEVALLTALVLDLANSLKSRAACELSFVVDTAEPDAFRLFGEMTTANLLARVAADDPYDAYLALAVLRGVAPKGVTVPAENSEGLDRACEIIHRQLPPAHARAAAAALRRPLDGMSIAIFPAFRLGLGASDADARHDAFPLSRRIGRYSSEAYDQHERFGRKAIRRLAETATVHVPRRLTAAARYAAVADAVFVEEGQLLDRWVASAELLDVREQADRYTLARHGLNEGEAAELRSSLRAALDELNDHRTDVVQEAAKPSTLVQHQLPLDDV